MDTPKWRSLAIVLVVLMSPAVTIADSLMGGHLDNQASTTEDVLRQHLNVVSLAFNGGQPFSLEKDPITGQINFEKTPPLKALNYTYDDKEDTEDKEDIDVVNEMSDVEHRGDDDAQLPNEINPYSPSFHDYLNLPIHYSNHEKYTNDKIPLISSSYANTKVQGGSSSYKIYSSLNHKDFYNVVNNGSGGKMSTSQSYSNTRTPYVPRSTTTRRPTTRITTTPRTTPITQRTTTSTQRTTPTTRRTTPTEPVTTWKPHRPIDRYGEDYEEMLPIEKMQNGGHRGDQPFMNYPKYDYEERYDDYYHPERMTTSKTTTTMSTTPTTATPTTTTPTTTTSTTTMSTTTTMPTTTTTTTTMKTTSRATPTEPPRASQAALIGVKRPQSNNIIVNGHQNYPSFDGETVGYPVYNGFVVESSSNVIVPPDQDTVSFVLGNRQNVQGTYYGHGSAMANQPYGGTVVMPNRMDTGNLEHDLTVGVPPRVMNVPVKGGFHTKVPGGGTQLTEQPFQGHDNVPNMQNKPIEPTLQLPSREVSPQQVPSTEFQAPLNDFQTPPKEFQPNNQQKWWFNSDQSDKSQSVLENDKDNRVNAGPGYRVVFPTEPSTSTTNVPSSTMTPPSSEKPELSELSEVLVPPAAVDKPIRPPQNQRPHYIPPPHHLHYHHLPPRSGPGYKVRPIDLELPNVLPRFRPNLKSSIRRGGEAGYTYEAIGTIPVGPISHKYGTRSPIRPSPHLVPTANRMPPRIPPASPLQRLKPPPPPPVHALRLPAPEALVDLRSQDSEHVPQKEPPIRRNVGVEGLIDERNRGSAILKSRLNDESSDKLERPSLPPRPPVFFRRRNGNDTKVETLQMIQLHGAPPEEPEEQMQDDETQEQERNADKRVGEAPVFAVYPVKSTIDIHSDDSENKNIAESVVIGTLGAQRPLPPDTLSQQQEEEEEEELPPVPVRASDFPYPLERPDPSLFLSHAHEKPLLVPSEPVESEEQDDELEFLNTRDNDANVNIIPYLQDHSPFGLKPNAISTTLHIGFSSGTDSGSTETPIAYVYTPTMEPVQHQYSSSEIYERNPVILPSQQPSSSSSSAPAPQSFMAPFFASLSAEAPSRDGWSVLAISPVKAAEAQDKMDGEMNEEQHERAGNSTMASSSTDVEQNTDSVQTESIDFDSENFKPQLFGGFQPILEFPTDSREVPSELKNSAVVGVMEKPRGIRESSSEHST